MLVCRNPECEPSPFFISIAASEHHIDAWGITLTYNNKQYYLESYEDSKWDDDDDEDLLPEQIVMIPTTVVEYLPPGDGSSTVITVPRWYPYPKSKKSCQRILEHLVNLVPFT